MTFKNIFLLRRFEELGQSPPDSQSKTKGPGGGRDKVVVADANVSDLDHFASILTNFNLLVLKARDGRTALDLVREHHPALVLAALDLPGLDGYKLAKEMRESKETEDIPFMFVVESGELPDQVVGHQTYANDYIQKPVSVPELKQRVGALVRLGERRKAGMSLPHFEPVGRSGAESSHAEDGAVRESPLARKPQIEDDDFLETLRQMRSLLESLGECVERLQDWSRSPQPTPNSRDQEDRAKRDRVDRKNAPVGGCEDSLASSWREVSGRVTWHCVDVAPLGQLYQPEGSDERFRAPESSSALYQEACELVLESLRAVDARAVPDPRRTTKLVQDLITSLDAGPDLLLLATDRRQGFSICNHSANVAILSIRLARVLERPWRFLCRVGLAALLHEVGVVHLPAKLMYRNGDLSRNEVKTLRERPLLSARILRGMGPGYVWLGDVVSQIFERESGNGFPLGLKGNEILEEAKIIGITDFFEACIHQRPYREPLTGYQALSEITTKREKAFCDRIVKGLIKSVSLYPYNEFVVLNTREVGRVVDINPENLSRPRVELLYDPEGACLGNPRLLDLAQEPELYISKAVNVADLPA
jgi:response regulator RpfG family c-di-GMP phosphodiesterase